MCTPVSLSVFLGEADSDQNKAVTEDERVNGKRNVFGFCLFQIIFLGKMHADTEHTVEETFLMRLYGKYYSCVVFQT